MEKWHSTTVVCVRHGGKVAMASDGQVTLGTTIMKQTAAKIRRLKGGEVIAGFAGSSADAFALFSRFEAKLDEHRGNLERSAIELAKDWRTDKILRQLEALLIVADKQSSLLDLGHGRPDLARGGRARHRLRRRLRARRGARSLEAQAGALGRGHRPRVAPDRRADRHLHERPDHPRRGLRSGMVFMMPGEKEAEAPPAAARTPREIVVELDKYVIGQKRAKKAVAIALRNRWRRQRLSPEMSREILPKNILMIGPTGVGKTEIARRLARLADAPFIKVEASKFTEVGYVGRDVESIVRDLTEVAVQMVREEKTFEIRDRARARTEQRLLDLLLPALSDADAEETRNKLRILLRDGKLEDRMVEIEVADKTFPSFEIVTNQGVEEMDINVKEMLPGLFGGKKKRRKTSVGEARQILQAEEEGRLVDPGQVAREAVERAQASGIVFLDEIDKVAGRESGRGPDVSREGVQRDLLPIVEGTSVNTKYGFVKTDHVLFIAAGAFHVSKPSDLIPELQGRFPIRVELDSLTEGDFVRILTEPENALLKQYRALLGAEGVDLSFSEDAIGEIARDAERVNRALENIGARRLHTILERLLEDLSFAGPENAGKSIRIELSDVQGALADLVQDEDLSRYVL